MANTESSKVRRPGARSSKTKVKTQTQTKATASIDAVTLAVLNGRLEQIADEMDATLFRAAFNPIIAEAHDASHGLYHADSGETLVQGKSGLPIFVGAMSFAVKAVIDKAKGEFADGDVYIFNDAYDGGTHLNDFKLVRPFFRHGKLFCHLASVGHWHDIGGNVPGNYNPAATECFQEAVLVPPVKLYAAGQLRSDVVDLLRANSRQPNSLYGDMNGQVNALALGARRLNELLDEYGDALVLAAMAELRARAVKLMRANIAELPPGRYHCTDWLDNDGATDVPLAIALDLHIERNRLTLDFSRSAKACLGPVNIARSTTVAACYVALKHVFPDVPANAGVLDPVQVIIPEDSMLAVRAPRPVGGYTETILRIIDVIFGALAKAAPTRVNGMAYGTINALSLAGYRSDPKRRGQRWVMFSFFGGGHGGHPLGDGLNHGNAPISTATIPPCEILEAAYPVMFTQWALRPDSGGDGMHRGGLGAIYEIELLENTAEAFIFAERGKFAPAGVAGGKPAAKNVFRWRSRLASHASDAGAGKGGKGDKGDTGDTGDTGDKGDRAGVWHVPPGVSKMVGIRLQRGDRVRIESPGGGGYGLPSRRSAAARARDLRLGYVTAASVPKKRAGKRKLV